MLKIEPIEILKSFYVGEMNEEDFLDKLYNDVSLQTLLEDEKKIGTHTGYENLLLYLLDTEEDLKSIFYSKITKPIIKIFLEEKEIHLDHAPYLSTVLDVWIGQDLNYQDFNKLTEKNRNGNCLFQKYFRLENAFCDWDHAITEFFELNFPIEKLIQSTQFGDLYSNVKEILENRNIVTLSCLIALPDLNSEVKINNHKNIIYLGKVKMSWYCQ